MVNNGGTYVHSATSASANGAATDFPGTTQTFGAASTVIITAWASGGPTPVALPSPTGGWGNLTINVASLGGNWQQSGGLTNVNGNLTIQATGGGTTTFLLTTNVAFTLAIAGNLNITGGILDYCNSTVNFASGNGLYQPWRQFQPSERSHVSGLCRQRVTGQTFTFTGGAASVNWTLAGTFKNPLGKINLTIATTKTVNLQNNLALTGPPHLHCERLFELSARM